ncbi:hypothetical protein LCGC14_0163230 [marine sediment metagenome]|uniref:Uncharacterized protein n=1 Tax=marine sediment metagenome TaxID=412755 RepID=A0A0F9UY76_9ZZZZ
MTEPIVLDHDELVRRAIKWLTIQHCKAVASEFPMHAGEEPDAFGWLGNGWSILVECKATKGDFYSDRRKKYRNPGFGVGQERWYMCQPGVLEAEDVEKHGWGLLYCTPKNIRKICLPPKTMTVPASKSPERRVFDESVRKREMGALVRLIRRAQIKGFDWKWGPNLSKLPT